MLKMWFTVSVQPLKGLESKVRHTGGQACLHDWAPITLWTPRLGWALPVVNTLCVSSHIVTETSIHCPRKSPREGNWKLPACNSPGALSYAPLALADLNLNHFAVINHKPERVLSPSSKLLNLNVVLIIPELATDVRSEGGLEDFQIV